MFSLGPATAARAGDLSPQTVITEEILAPRPWASGRFALPDLASLYASRYAPVTLGHYRGLDEQEPTSGQGGESERFIACGIQAESHGSCRRR